jgi:hypothetical protein
MEWRNVIRGYPILQIHSMSVTVPEKEIGLIIDKLDQVRLEILRLRAVLIPEEEPTQEEKKALEEARKEIAEGACVSLEELLRELG